MSAIILLIGFSLLIAIGFLISFIFSVKSGQFDDTYTPAVRILHEENILSKVKTEGKNSEEINQPITNNLKSKTSTQKIVH